LVGEKKLSDSPLKAIVTDGYAEEDNDEYWKARRREGATKKRIGPSYIEDMKARTAQISAAMLHSCQSVSLIV
jgi:hypothetical protein